MKSIKDCKSISQVNKVLKEQGLVVRPTAFIACQTIKEIIDIAINEYGAK